MKPLRPTFVGLSALLSVLMLTTGCSADGDKKEDESGAGEVVSVEEGIASHYSDNLHGGPTASGETYDMNAMTAAHKTLPFNTKVRVTNKNNGKSVVVRINDRGPFIEGRIIDLSGAAADQVGLRQTGIAPATVEVLK